jgi:hypothetical protein
VHGSSANAAARYSPSAGRDEGEDGIYHALEGERPSKRQRLGQFGGRVPSGSPVWRHVFKSGSQPQAIAMAPEFVWELSLGIHLMVKGFKPRTVHKCVQAAPRYSCRSPPSRSRWWDVGQLILATEGWFDGGIRRLQPERPVRTVDVVVLDIDPQDLLEVAAPDDQQPVQALGAHRPDPTFRMGVPFAACTGVISTSAPFEQNTSPKLRENVASWSRSRKHRRRPRSPTANNRMRPAVWPRRRWGGRSPQPGPGGCSAR